MYTNEAKVIEVLLNYLDNDVSLNRIVNDSFDSMEEFQSYKINLFNIKFNFLIDKSFLIKLYLSLILLNSFLNSSILFLNSSFLLISYSF